MGLLNVLKVGDFCCRMMIHGLKVETFLFLIEWRLGMIGERIPLMFFLASSLICCNRFIENFTVGRLSLIFLEGNFGAVWRIFVFEMIGGNFFAVLEESFGFWFFLGESFAKLRLIVIILYCFFLRRSFFRGYYTIITLIINIIIIEFYVVVS